MLYKLDMLGPQKNDCWNKMDIAIGFLFHGRVCQTVYRTQRKVTDKLPTQVRQFKLSCFAEESARHTMAYRLKKGHFRRTLGN